jgi:hypothetical protein
LYEQEIRAIPFHVQTKKHQMHLHNNNNDNNNDIIMNTNEELNNNISNVNNNIISKRDKIFNNLRVAYYIIKTGKPLNSYQSIINLIDICHGAASSIHYISGRACYEFMYALNQSQHEIDQKEIENALFYSFAVDSNTLFSNGQLSLFAK